MDGHAIVTSLNGQEAVDKIREDRAFDCILMVGHHTSFVAIHTLIKMM